MNLLNKLGLLKKRGEELKTANMLGAKQAAINFGESAVDLLADLTAAVDLIDFESRRLERQEAAIQKIGVRLERIERLNGLHVEVE